jgi:undecaprenyl-diphosphatase
VIAHHQHILRRRSNSLWLFGFAALLAGFLVTALVHLGHTQSLDDAIFGFIRELTGVSASKPNWVTEAYRDLTALGSVSVLGLAVICASVYLFALQRLKLGFLLIASALLANGFSSGLKLLMARARPDLGTDMVVHTFTASFPSGHALLSAAIILTIGGILAKATADRAGAYAIVGLALLLTFLIGLSRLILGVHWPSDVLAGWLFGTGWASLTLVVAGSIGASQRTASG